jgi:hypothetical protein
MHIRAVQGYQPVKYKCSPLSPWLDTKLSEYNAFLVLFYTSWASHFKFLLVRVAVVGRKILVLDLDETLIHSHHDGFTLARQVARPSYPPDFILKVEIDKHPVRFFVHKRPHVDFFLEIVSQWYDLAIFTASMEIYGAAVAEKLDNGRNILSKRYYRQVMIVESIMGNH